MLIRVMAMMKWTVQEEDSKDWGSDLPGLIRSHPANLHAYTRNSHDETDNPGKRLKNRSPKLNNKISEVF
jgi:hypothetical protein